MTLFHKISIFTCCLIFGLQSPLIAQENKDIAAVKSILFRQQSDWNNGNIDAFMNGYWESNQLKFVGATGITYGYKATQKRYHKRYPNTAAMGKLTFEVVEVEKLSRKVIMLIGKWGLGRNIGDIGGHFTLMWKKIKGDWVIISDHTSVEK